MVRGPVELIVVRFDGNRFRGELWPELERLKENDVVRLIDLLLIRKDRSGALAMLTATDLGLEEMLDFGVRLGSLVGTLLSESGSPRERTFAQLAEHGHVFDKEDARILAADLPRGAAVAVALIEHRWALPLRSAIGRAGGEVVSDAWLDRATFERIGEVVPESVLVPER